MKFLVFLLFTFLLQTAKAQSGPIDHVFIIVLENTDYKAAVWDHCSKRCTRVFEMNFTQCRQMCRKFFLKNHFYRWVDGLSARFLVQRKVEKSLVAGTKENGSAFDRTKINVVG